MDRYNNATAAEKAQFTQFSKILKGLTHISERQRELKGEKSWIKFIFDLKANNPHIHAMEFGVKKGEVANIRLVVSVPTKKSEFYTQALKIGKALYGGIVLHFDCEGEKEAKEILTKLDILAEESEIITLNPKRTYCDPPQGWVKDLTGKEGVTKEPTPSEDTEEEKAA
jgi:hypothetical protein